MTPAIELLKRERIAHRVHAYDHDPGSEGYGAEAVEALGLHPAQCFKTLLAALAPAGLAVAVLPVPERLDLKALAAAAGAKKAELCEPARAERATGYVVGGISPLGQRKTLPTFLDQSALGFEAIYLSAGKRGLEISLSPNDLVRLLGAQTAPLAKR